MTNKKKTPKKKTPPKITASGHRVVASYQSYGMPKCPHDSVEVKGNLLVCTVCGKSN